jgi:uncharacterized membrane protein YdjX (TVP38/TMEM64 family)
MRRLRERARRVRQRLRAARFVLIRVLLLAVFVAVIYFGLRAAGVDISVDAIEDFGDDLGLAGWIAYVPAAIVLNCVWLLAIPVAAAAAGLLFGNVAGTFLTILVAGGSAAVQNWIGRRWVGERAEHLLGERGKRLDELLDSRGFEAIFYLRLTPLTPFTALNYASGLTRLSPAAIGTASALAMGPRIYAYAVLGGNLDDPLSSENILPVAIIVAGGVVGVALILRAGIRHRRAQ